MILQRRFVIAEMVVTGFLALCLLFTIIFWTSPDLPDSWPLADIENNWRMPLIDDVEVVGTDGKCSQGFEPLAYEFEGYRPFYVCQKEGLYRTETSPVDQSCSKKEIPAKKFNKWPNGKQICIKRLSGVTYESIFYNLKSDKTCPEGFIKCGGNSVTTKDPIEPVCINAKYSRCPVSSIKIMAPTDIEPEMELGSVSRKSLEDGTKDVVIYRHSFPVVEVMIEESMMCPSEKRPILEGRPRFPFEIATKTSCTKNEDTRFTSGGRILEEDYFKANLPEFSDALINVKAVSNIWAYFLQSRKIIPYSISCRNSFKQVLAFRSSEESSVSDMSKIRIILWVYLFLLIAILALQGVSYFLKKSLYWHIRTLVSCIVLLSLLLLLLIMLIITGLRTKVDSKALSAACLGDTSKMLARHVAIYDSISFSPLVFLVAMSMLGGLAFAVIASVQKDWHSRIIGRPGLINKEMTYGEGDTSFDWNSFTKSKKENASYRDSDVYKDAQPQGNLTWI